MEEKLYLRAVVELSDAVLCSLALLIPWICILSIFHSTSTYETVLDVYLASVFCNSLIFGFLIPL